MPGSSTLTVTDRLVNRSAYGKEFELIYHTNLGAGAGLEEGAEFLAPVATVGPFDAAAAADLAVDLGAKRGRPSATPLPGAQTAAETAAPKGTPKGTPPEVWRSFRGPTRGFGERVYKVTTHADPRTGVSLAALVGARGDRGVAVAYTAASLPCLTLWKNTDTVEDGYAVGLEPGTSFCHPMAVERAAGRVPVLPPGGQQTFSVAVRVLRGAREVDEVRSEVERLSAGRAPQVLGLETLAPMEK